MQSTQVTVSDSFKRMTVKAILSIIFFIFIYLVLLGAAMGITVLTGILGLGIIKIRVHWLTLVLGIGLISIGVLLLIFLVKFVFKKYRVDRSGMVEITEADQPELFAVIREISEEVHTDFPKKVYLTADVNASVSYDSSFWSMFLPVKKNLQIGIGLVNTVTVSEFKAILAHEFGHFSQRTMKVGSYVYNVNQVIHNMLFDNESMEKLFARWSGLSNIFALCVAVVIKIITAIQWVLRQTYTVVNRSYLALSREMEFHADEVAANVMGSEPLITSLMRMQLADHSYNSVLNYYGGKISDSIKTKNIYPQHFAVMSFYASEDKLPLVDELPFVTAEYMGKFNRSKLVIKDQWASHPTMEERVAHLEKLGIPPRKEDKRLALTLFRNRDRVEEMLTEKLFEAVTYSGQVVWHEHAEFENRFKEDFKENSFSPLYNSYYDSKNPLPFDVEKETTPKETPSMPIKELFAQERVDMVYELVALENDLETLRRIQAGESDIKTFDYAGVKYRVSDISTLTERLAAELELMREKVRQHDAEIFRHFYTLAKRAGTEKQLADLYTRFFDLDKKYESKMEAYNTIVKMSEFMQYTLPLDQIQVNVAELKNKEVDFIKEVQELLDREVYEPSITPEIMDNFREFTIKKRAYIFANQYAEEDVKCFYTCMENYIKVMAGTYLRLKKEILRMQVELEG